MTNLIAIMKVLKFMINLFITLQVYCVAYNETYKTKFFRKENRGFKSVGISISKFSLFQHRLKNQVGRYSKIYKIFTVKYLPPNDCSTSWVKRTTFI